MVSNQLDLIIKGNLVLPNEVAENATIGVKDGVIVGLFQDDEVPTASKTIDATGKLVLPGVIDVHVHMELPVAGTVSSDDFGSGSTAAAFGGVTTLIDFS